MSEPQFTDAELHHAVEALSDPERFRSAEGAVARAAPALQRVLIQALDDGGWFGEGQETEVRRVLEIEDERERSAALRALLTEETRLGMMVGVAVGWGLREELTRTGDDSSDG
jgi:hypothetical protein